MTTTFRPRMHTPAVWTPLQLFFDGLTYNACRMHSSTNDTKIPLAPVSISFLRPILSTNSAVKTFPGKLAVIHSARSRSGIYPEIPSCVNKITA